MIGTHIPVGRSARKHHLKCVARDLPNVTGRRKHEEPQNPTPSYIAASYVGFELFDWTALSAFLLENEELINYFKFEVIKPGAVRLTQFSQQAAGFF